jgi:NAD(P)-dependent dehydrogenase (short-subunit alcohol dehydrogenase family)
MGGIALAERFKDKVAIVTGGASGIGRATALAFAQEGASVVVADVMEQEGEETVKIIEDNGKKAIFIKTDVSKAADVQAMVDKTIKTYGRLDCAFNNAGIEGKSAPTAECTEENWDRVIAINLKGVWLCTKYEIPPMIEQGRGAIVNMSSVAGIVGFNGLPAYCASKGGIIQLTKTAALEYSNKGIRINAVCPGAIITPMLERIMAADPKMKQSILEMHPIGRLGKPEEIADAVLWLCSDDASFVTGHPLVVDGGLVAR